MNARFGEMASTLVWEGHSVPCGHQRLESEETSQVHVSDALIMLSPHFEVSCQPKQNPTGEGLACLCAKVPMFIFCVVVVLRESGAPPPPQRQNGTFLHLPKLYRNTHRARKAIIQHLFGCVCV